jgi:hypothetical protein
MKSLNATELDNHEKAPAGCINQIAHARENCSHIRLESDDKS